MKKTIRYFIDLLIENYSTNDSSYDALTYYFIDYAYNEKSVPDIKIKDPILNGYFNDIKSISKELKDIGIDSIDFLNPENIGFKDNHLCYFDIGFSSDDYINDEDVETLMENDYKNNPILDISSKIFKHLGIKPKPIGAGNFGIAFEYMGKIVKITKDISEGNNAKRLLNKNNDFLAKYYEVKPFKIQNKTYFFIVLEKLNIDLQKTKSIYHQLNKYVEHEFDY